MSISEIKDMEESDKRDLAVALISASSILSPVLRAKMAASLKLKHYVAIASVPVEEGALIPELISRRVVQGNAATYCHVAGLTWETKEAVLRTSPTFATWVTPELVGADPGPALITSTVSDETKRLIAERADEFAPLGGLQGLWEHMRV